MPNWIPKPEWKGQPVFIIGGGSSLRGFNFDLLKGKNTIGCNHAFQLGSEVVQLCLFCDPSFWEENQTQLEQFQGKVVTSAALDLRHKPVSWLLQMRRISHGLYQGHLIGWNYSTGAAAVNLALSLGAQQIYLLGFDMGVALEGVEKKPVSHWHDAHPIPPKEKSYIRFLRGFHTVANCLGKHYPQVVVTNVTNGTSRLNLFPTLTIPALESLLKEGK